ncbi:ABC transporter ATP-binding protein [Natranaerobius thermophilus]|uniref:ABC transporter related n=1 Tax=Natranaerobius thermophilus (strain ATCC BAA-1301 / DSM 18059 / JW/NM-WN-LF) TaxID=457570 RepID=B2A0M3_NATTJ|nr:ABC transporter ATP-binding protein [Natranaerobius thermophilus]ACB84581.1 ABC transporter related [Natranaerobius thermophilus JW/NM-WN-LF]
MSAICFENVSKKFGDSKIIDDFNLTIERGTVFGFIGPNGAGKTTTIKMLTGLIKPTTGSIKILNQDISNGYQILDHIGYVSEESNLYNYMTFQGILNFAKGFYTNWDPSLVDKYTEFFRLPLNQPIKEFSKGMKVKVSLVLALAHNPKILILDEPTSGLDPIFRREFLNVLVEEMTQSEKTIFFSSHIIDDVERIADQIGIINDGRLLKVRDMDELKTNEKKIRVVFQRDIESEFFDFPGIAKVEKSDNAYILTVSENFEEIYQRCKSKPHFTLDVIEQSLEDILINTSGR